MHLADGEIRAVAERVSFCARIVTKALSGQVSSKIP